MPILKHKIQHTGTEVCTMTVKIKLGVSERTDQINAMANEQLSKEHVVIGSCRDRQKCENRLKTLSQREN